jgi:hypothetical protein
MLALAADTAAAPEGVRVAGIVLAALLAAAAILGSSPGARAWAMLAALALTPMLLVLEIWETPQLDAVRERPVLALAAAAVAAALVVVPLGILFARRPAAIPLAALAASGRALPGLPRYEYEGLTGDATGFYAATREFIASPARLGALGLLALVAAIVLTVDRRAVWFLILIVVVGVLFSRRFG